MLGDQFLSILAIDAINAFVACIVKQQVVAYARTNETLLDTWQGIDRPIDVEQSRMVGVEIGANLGMDARGAFALVAKVEFLPMHGIHIGRRTSEVT